MEGYSAAVKAVLSHLDERERNTCYVMPVEVWTKQKIIIRHKKRELAVVFAWKNFQDQLLCQKANLFTDNELLKHGTNYEDTNWRIDKWISIFTEYHFEVRYPPIP